MKLALLIVILTFTWISTFAQSIDLSRLKSDSIVDCISTNKYDQIHESFLPQIQSKISVADLKYYIDMGSTFISEYGLPKFEEVKITVTRTKLNDKSISENDVVAIKTYEYGFPPAENLDKIAERIILISFIEEVSTDKIVSLQIADNSKRE